MIPELPRVGVAFVLSTLMAVRGRRKRSLSPGGAVAGFFVGFASLASSARFGATLFAFYVSGTRATRHKADAKRSIEDGYESSGGNRDAKQVLASSLPGVLISIAHAVLFRFDGPVTTVFTGRSALVLAQTLFFAACAGDTFASELGVPDGGQPVLVLAPWRAVPRGTNGGVTMRGTLASAAGGAVIGVAAFAAGPEWSFSQLFLIVVGTAGGFIGSTVDSALGQILQASWLDRKTGKVRKIAPSEEERSTGDLELICGRDVLSGESVNAIAAVLTACSAPLFIPLFREATAPGF